MGQVHGLIFGRRQGERVPPGERVDASEEGSQLLADALRDVAPVNQGVPCWTWFTENGPLCWSTTQHHCMQALERMKNGCVSCYGGVCTFLGCWGGCADLKARCEPSCPFSKKWALSKKALAALLENVATASVGIIFSLNMYFLTFAVVWAPDTFDCFPGLPISKAITKCLKIIAVGLPVTLTPPTLYVAGQAKALQFDLRGLGLVAGAVLFEVVYFICLGAFMTVCTFTSLSASVSPTPSAVAPWSPWKPVAVVTSCLLLLLGIAWGCCCHYPKVVCTMHCQQVCIVRYVVQSLVVWWYGTVRVRVGGSDRVWLAFVVGGGLARKWIWKLKLQLLLLLGHRLLRRRCRRLLSLCRGLLLLLWRRLLLQLWRLHRRLLHCMLRVVMTTSILICSRTS